MRNFRNITYIISLLFWIIGAIYFKLNKEEERIKRGLNKCYNRIEHTIIQ